MILVGPEGVVDHMVQDSSLDIETIVGEYTTLLHIARSASQDSGSGSLVENIVVSERSIMIARIPNWRLVPGTQPKILPATFARSYDAVHIEF